MKAGLECINCILEKAGERYEKFCSDPDGKLSFMKDVYRLVGASAEDITTPYLSKRVDDLLKERFEISDEFTELKSQFNNLMLGLEDKLADEIRTSEDPILTALKLTMTGNFIDFGADYAVDPEKLYELIETSDFHQVEDSEYKKLREDLKKGKKLVYLLDNAGEIVFDKLFIKTIMKFYPHLQITGIVRGYPVLNDVTYDDAKEVGLDKIIPIIDNGTAIPGTQLDMISKDSKEAILGADLIIAKGQGNIESLYGCGLNVYYIFLCKCDFFVKKFGGTHFSGLLKNELRMESYER